MILLLKLLALPLYPLGLSLVLMVIGIVLLKIGKKVGLTLLMTSCGTLFLMSSPMLSRLVVKSLENPYVMQAPLPRDCSAIVVLGGGGVGLAPPMRHPEVNEAGDRILHGARLYKEGFAKFVVTSGGGVVGGLHTIMTEAEQNALLLREIGVPQEAILPEKKALTTAQHPGLIAPILDSLGLKKKIILVTSATHMRRSVGVFKKAGFEIYPAATDFRGNGRIFEKVQDLFPQAGSLESMTCAIHEYYGIIGYTLLGKL